MKNFEYLPTMLSLTILLILTGCNSKEAETKADDPDTAQAKFGGYESQEKLGEHLVLIAGCHDCHTPKKMTPKGPDIDFSRALSGHPAQEAPPDVDRKQIESKGQTVTTGLTAWAGPWGVSFTANLTPDASGLENWDESNFLTAIRKGKHKGIESERDILPPMPWQMYQNMTDEELKAIFAYLKSIKPIKNVVPEPLPPVIARQ